MTDVVEHGGASVWIFGHTHISCDMHLGNTRMISNAKGYGPMPGRLTWDNSSFDPMFTLEI
jgi:hypothetical protein